MLKIAYLILAYKIPEQTIRLVRKLNAGNVAFFIHMDKKTDDSIYWEVVNRLSAFPNVHFVARQVCYWGHFSTVQAVIQGMLEIIDSGNEFDYVITLSGQDYPLLPNELITRTFEKNKGLEFMEHFSLPCHWPQRGMDRIEGWYVISPPNDPNGTVVRKEGPKRKFPKGFTPFGGSGWYCLTGDCVKYIYSFVEKNSEFVDFFRYVLVPEEIFFHTIVLNSPFKDKVVNEDLRYIEWPPNASNPRIFVKDDFPRIIKPFKLFVRKFDITVDAEILDMIDYYIKTIAVMNGINE